MLVVGAGPAGVGRGDHARRAPGATSCVVDKAVFPRDKCCGDGLTTLALRELERLGFDPATVPDWSTSSTAPCCARRRAARSRVPLPPDRARSPPSRRGCELDAALVDARRRRPASTCARATASTAPIAGRADHVVVGVDGLGAVAARYVVAADGMWSPVRKALGARPSPATSASGTPSASTPATSTGPAAEQLYVWFDADLLPGYAWSFPLPGGRANIGFGVLRDGDAHGPGHEATLWRDLLDRPHIARRSATGFELEGRHTAWPIPARVDRATLADGPRAVRRRRRRRRPT